MLVGVGSRRGVVLVGVQLPSWILRVQDPGGERIATKFAPLLDPAATRFPRKRRVLVASIYGDLLINKSLDQDHGWYEQPSNNKSLFSTSHESSNRLLLYEELHKHFYNI